MGVGCASSPSSGAEGVVRNGLTAFSWTDGTPVSRVAVRRARVPRTSTGRLTPLAAGGQERKMAAPTRRRGCHVCRPHRSRHPAGGSACEVPRTAPARARDPARRGADRGHGRAAPAGRTRPGARAQAARARRSRIRHRRRRRIRMGLPGAACGVGGRECRLRRGTEGAAAGGAGAPARALHAGPRAHLPRGPHRGRGGRRPRDGARR